MVRSVGSGGAGPISPETTSIDKSEAPSTSNTVQKQDQPQESSEIRKGALSNATSRISESAISSKLLATQLQAQVPAEKPTAVVGSAVSKKGASFRRRAERPRS